MMMTTMKNYDGDGEKKADNDDDQDRGKVGKVWEKK